MTNASRPNSRLILSCAVTLDEFAAVDAIARQQGKTREEWLYALVAQVLAGNIVNRSENDLPSEVANPTLWPAIVPDDDLDDEPDEILYDFLSDDLLSSDY